MRRTGSITAYVEQQQGTNGTIHGVSSWQVDKNYNRSAWFADNGNSFVADFTNQIVYFVDVTAGQAVCQWTCALSFLDVACNAPNIDEQSLCNDDYIHKSKFIGVETIDGQSCNHFNYADTTGLQQSVDIWTSVATGNPVRHNAAVYVLGTSVANMTADFTSFTAGTPPASNFAFSGAETCYPGTRDQCQNSQRARTHPASAAVAAAVCLNLCCCHVEASVELIFSAASMRLCVCVCVCVCARVAVPLRGVRVFTSH
jgi:hypothetical protein